MCITENFDEKYDIPYKKYNALLTYLKRRVEIYSSTIWLKCNETPIKTDAKRCI